MQDPQTPRTIGFRLEGSVEDSGRVRFPDLIEFLQRLRAALKRVEGTVAGSDRSTIYYRIVDMEVSSAAIVLEGVPEGLERDPIPEILDRVDSSLSAVIEGHAPPPWLDRELLETLKGLTLPLRRHVRAIHILRPHRSFTLNREFETKVDQILGEDLTAVGSISGFLDAINVHGVRHFHVYPLIGPTKILCVFADELLPEVRKGLKRHVTVSGILRYKMNEAFPHQVDVESIEVMPLAEELPTLRSVRGLAPDATGPLDSVAFVRQLRDASES
jgi:hypothetical protein